MKRLGTCLLVILALGGAVALSSGVGGGWKTFFPLEDRNPVTHLKWNDELDEFRFAVVSDRTGGHRADVFAQAVAKLNLLQPEFVVSVGDLIEGGKLADEKYVAQWQDFDALVNKLSMPFFYVAGNHDAGSKESAAFWSTKLGRRHYHFLYRNVLFLMLNSDDPPGDPGAISKEQLAWVEQTLKDNAKVRWTIVTIHRPLWTAGGGAKNGWADVEKALMGRPYTVFAGHVHRYEKFVRQGMNYYQFATTGGVSRMRGVEFGEFDHLVWVTMKKDGPVLANILTDAVHTESMQPIKTAEPGVSTAKRKATHRVSGQAHFEGTPMPGAVVTFTGESGDAKGVTAVGMVEADGTFQLSTYKGFDGAPAGDYKIAVAWRTSGKTGPSLLPARYNTAAKSGLTATIQPGANKLALELHK